MKLAPMHSTDQAFLVLDLLRWCDTNKVHSVYPVEFSCMKSHFDHALQKTHSYMKANEQGTKAWWETVKGFVGQIVPVQDLL